MLRDLGGSGEVECETEAMLLEQGVDYSEFPDAALAHLPPLPWSIPPQVSPWAEFLQFFCHSQRGCTVMLYSICIVFNFVRSKYLLIL